MDLASPESNQSVYQPPFPHSPPPPPPPTPQPPPGGLDSRISPSILLVIVVVAVIFFVSGLLHLLVRHLVRPNTRDLDEPDDSATALQGQLQHLFHLHDAGVDQSFIDALPVFLYGAIIGLKDPFDCAVCLCEFEADDKLRLLPKCSHAFHLDCIDTWLLSHSTCPLCRSSLVQDLSPRHSCSPVVFVLESGSESSREVIPDIDLAANNSSAFPDEGLGSSTMNDAPQRTEEIAAKEDMGTTVAEASEPPAVVVPVKLGKFRDVDVGAGDGGEGNSSTSNGNVDQRRCFSMGTFEYVMDETSLLRVAVKPLATKSTSSKKPSYRPAMSECGGCSRREGFRWFQPARGTAELRSEDGSGDAHITSTSQSRESFSISKIWLRPSREKPVERNSSRRAVSFRLPPRLGEAGEETDGKGGSSRGTTEKVTSEVGLDVEAGGCSGRVVSRSEETPSFARRTMLWIAGRHHKVVNHGEFY